MFTECANLKNAFRLFVCHLLLLKIFRTTGESFFGIISTFVAVLEAELYMHILAYRKLCLAILRSEKRKQMLFRISAPRGSISWSWAQDFFAKSAVSGALTSTQHVGAK